MQSISERLSRVFKGPRYNPYRDSCGRFTSAENDKGECTPDSESSETTGGDCYVAAGNYMFKFRAEGMNERVIVHGEVTGQGSIEGLKFGHAWIEEGDMVIDTSNGRDIRMPKIVYYALGNIGDNVHKYTTEEFTDKIVETGHWGPWDLVTSSGL